MIDQIKIMLAEDHVSVRQAYVTVLNGVENFHVIGDAGNGMELLKLMRRTTPHVVIADIEMPEMNGIEMAKIIHRDFPDVKVIFLSMHYSEAYASDILTNGANAFLPKECDLETLIEAVNVVYRNGFFMNKTTSRYLLANMLTEKKLKTIIQQLSLTNREIEILRHICDGLTNKAIADKLCLSPATVDFHRQKIYSKTCSTNIVELVKYAIRYRLIEVV